MNAEFEKLDDFTKMKKIIQQKIKKIREVLEKRDNYVKNKMQTEAVRASFFARTQIDDVYKDAETLKIIFNKEEKKLLEMGEKDKGYVQLVENRKDIIRLILAHIQECEFLEAQRNGNVVNEKKKKKKKKTLR
eukprot:gnl/Spiro4/7050_TR3663_c0_g2_i1.p1 gnl/Spiro4/7050_TR3663_c0_g2~~gnl/Spiro4/7050_TR3663_c0_g2_i1.p1  ORF type:complete len:156 (-),score=9.49 gnl/Spiro4/7050_TR3663_c0_g2_i1:4-402(-)